MANDSKEKKVWTKEEILEQWPQAAVELGSYQRFLEPRSWHTATQLEMALQMAGAEFNRMSKFPRYHLIVDGEDKWFGEDMVGAAYDSGMVKVEMGVWVQDGPDDPPRKMTKAEQQMIVVAADAYSASK